MIARGTEVEEINFITQSPVRVAILSELAEEENLESAELQNRIDASRSTIQRNLDALKSHDFIRNSHPAYSITPLGELIEAEIDSVLEMVAVGQKLRPFLKWVPEDEFDLDPRVLVDATVIPVSTGDPYAAENHHIKRMKEVNQVHAILPVTGQRAWEVVRERTLEGELDSELIIGQHVADAIRETADYRRILRELIQTGNHETYVVSDEIPFYVGLLDEYVQIGVHDEEGLPRALLESDASEVYDWAEQTFESYYETADPFTL